jgi:hypothetical protein
MPYICKACHSAKGVGKGKKKKKSGKSRKSKKGCHVGGVAVPKKVCACVRREMKGVRADKSTKKRMTKNAVSQCKRE